MLKVPSCELCLVEYFPDTGTLSVCTRKDLGEGFTVTPNLVVFYDPVDEDCPVGFILHSADVELKPFLDAVMSKHQDDKTKKSTKA